MRSMSAKEQAAAASESSSTHVKVSIETDGAGGLTEITNYLGRNWLESATIQDDVDAPGITAELVLRREEYELSLATLMQSSRPNQQPFGTYLPFLTVNRDIKIEVAVMGGEAKPSTADWVNIFQGEIDEIDWGGDAPFLTLKCRDKSAPLADGWVENSSLYASASMQSVMQSILNDWGGSPTLYTPVSPSFTLLAYIQQKDSVLNAIRKITQVIGWDVKYRWDSGTSAWRLTLFTPDRSKTTPDYTLVNSQVLGVERLMISRADIRNAVKVVYTDSSTGARTTYTATDAPSITKYGRRFMEVAEDATSQIDTAGEAQTLAERIRDDLEEPTAELGGKIAFFPWVETGDLYRFPANARWFDSNQDLAVSRWKHTLTREKHTTDLELRGKPSGGFARWLRIEARDGLASASDSTTPTTPSNGAAVATLGSLEITYDAPTDPDWSYSECHVSTSNGFTPTNATKEAEARTTKFIVGGLIPGTTYYVKIIAVDKFGNRSSASTQVTKATALLGPNHEDLQRDNVNAAPNGEFVIWSPPNTQAANPPDSWEVIKVTDEPGTTFVVDNTLWGSGAAKVYYDGSVHDSANVSIKIDCSSMPASTYWMGIQTKTEGLIPVGAGDIWRALVATRYDDTTGPDFSDGDQFRIEIIYYQADKSTIVSTDTLFSIAYGSSGAWYSYVAWTKVPTNAKWARIRMYVNQWFDDPQTTRIDRVGFFKDYPDFRAVADSSQSITNSVWTKVNASDAASGDDDWDHEECFDDANDRFTAPTEGYYRVQGSVGIDGLVTGKYAQAAIYVNGAALALGATASSVGATETVAQVATDVYLQPTDYVELYCFHNDTTSRNRTNNATMTFFNGRKSR